LRIKEQETPLTFHEHDDDDDDDKMIKLRKVQNKGISIRSNAKKNNFLQNLQEESIGNRLSGRTEIDENII
jgi:hypothetical protein